MQATKSDILEPNIRQTQKVPDWDSQAKNQSVVLEEYESEHRKKI